MQTQYHSWGCNHGQSITVNYLESDLITTEDENGNEVLEDISEYEAYKIYQQLKSLKEDNHAAK